MYSEKPKYDITNFLNTNKVAWASYGMSGAPITWVATPNVASRKEEAKPTPVKTTTAVPSSGKPTFKAVTQQPETPTYSASVKTATANIGGKPIVVPKKRVLTDAQKLGREKLKAIGVKLIASNKVFNSKKIK